MPRDRKKVGYCLRCGGDGYDDGENFYHRCPRKRPEAEAVVAVKSACDDLKSIVARRSWAAIIRKDDLADVVKAVDHLSAKLVEAYP